MAIGDEFSVFFKWFRIRFTENPGMAFGWVLGGEYGKLALTLFRIVAVGVLTYFVRFLIKEKAKTIIILSLSLILAGAIGNIIDSLFYGVFFEESSRSARNIANFLPQGGGYASPFYGKVVDMLYMPVYQGYLPDWVPIYRGHYMIFFRPIFNVADASITLGVILILLFQRSFFSDPVGKPKELPETD